MANNNEVMELYSFQLVSDIHIEKRFPDLCDITEFITVSAKNLILAGDIGSIYQEQQLMHFFRSCKSNFETVIFVPGNNEYYTRDGFDKMTFGRLNCILEDICTRCSIILLNNSCFETDDLIIFGSIWWSFIPEELTMRIQMDNGLQITSDDFNYMHALSRICLNSVIMSKGNKRLLVITHYCPTKMGTMNSHHRKDDFISLVPYYFSSSEQYLSSGKIDAWIFGHTHVFRDFVFNRSDTNRFTRIISNADPRKKFFRRDFVFEV